jgi:hypothetical protein
LPDGFFKQLQGNWKRKNHRAAKPSLWQKRGGRDNGRISGNLATKSFLLSLAEW